MNTWVIYVGIGLVALAVIGYVGIRVPPRKHRDHPEPTQDRGVIGVPPGLPEPVFAYFERISPGGVVPRAETAITWGRGVINRADIPSQVRFKAHYRPGEAFARENAYTWWGIPVSVETDAHPTAQIDFDYAKSYAALMWAESLWAPFAYLAEPNARWEAIDEANAHLHLPFGNDTITLTFAFNLQTDLVRRVSTERVRDGEVMRWHLEPDGWARANDLIVLPRTLAFRWDDEDAPYAVLRLDGMAYNVDVGGRV